MKTITVPTADQVSPESLVYFEAMKKRLGKVPNLYATIGYSSIALKAFLDMDGTFSHGRLNGKEREAIALVVSEENGCQYCLAGHTLAATRYGLSEAEIIEIRKGHAENVRMNAIVQLAKSMTGNKGHAEQQYLDQFFDAGLDEAALMEVIGLIALRISSAHIY